MPTHDYDRRVRVVLVYVLADRRHFLHSFARSSSPGVKRVKFQLPRGHHVSLTFEHLAPLYPDAAGSRVVGTNSVGPARFEVSVGGRTMLQANIHDGSLDVLSYVPGHWERDFGIENHRDDPILLPAALR